MTSKYQHYVQKLTCLCASPTTLSYLTFLLCNFSCNNIVTNLQQPCGLLALVGTGHALSDEKKKNIKKDVQKMLVSIMSRSRLKHDGDRFKTLSA